MKDKTTKLLLALIAVALWAQLLVPFIHPVRVKANDATEEDMLSKLSSIETDVSGIAVGTCVNETICK